MTELRNFHERLLYLRNLEERKEAIKKNIEEQGKLTKELAKQIEEAGSTGEWKICTVHISRKNVPEL